MDGPKMYKDAAARYLEWCIEIGADECIGEGPVDRVAFGIEEAARKKKRNVSETKVQMKPEPLAANLAPAALPLTAAVSDAVKAATAARSLDELRAAVADYEHCELKPLAQNLVFSDGNPASSVMIIGEAPGADEDRIGKPFVGRAGRLLDRMFVEIGLGRAEAGAGQSLYITNILPWRPPGNRTPNSSEVEMMKPFVVRHVELVGPKLLVLMGNSSCSALLGKSGITRLRGIWTEWQGLPVMPMFHPAYLLRNPLAKREAWIDLLMIRKFLAEQGQA